MFPGKFMASQFIEFRPKSAFCIIGIRISRSTMEKELPVLQPQYVVPIPGRFPGIAGIYTDIDGWFGFLNFYGGD
jgi:hypothetical protein